MAKAKPEKTSSEKLLMELEKKYGVTRKANQSIDFVTSGSIQLDKALGCGGSPLGKVIEIFGPESSGKSTITLHQIAEYQKKYPDKKVALFDFEHCFDSGYAESIGVNTDELIIYQPDNQETGYDMLLGLIENELISCAVIDSQTAAIPQKIIEGEMGDVTMGLQARNNSKFLGKVKGLLDKHKVTLFIISQTRANIGGMGDPTVTTGGNALKFYADMRWKVWKINDKINELNKTTVTIVKNKLAKPFGEAKIDILWGVGIDKMGEIIDLAVDLDLISKGGPWFTIDGMKLQGKDAVRDWLKENPEKLEEFRNKIIEHYGKTEVRIDEDDSKFETENGD